MPEISLQQIKELREKTGAGIMDAKKILKETGGNLEKAVELLRKKGKKIAESKQSRAVKEGWIGHYVHTNGKVASLVELFCETDFVARNSEFQELAHDLAMQIAAMEPKYLNPEEIPAEVIEKEKEVYRDQLKTEKKPKNIIDKIIEGKLEKFYSEICLTKQPYFKEEKITIEELVAQKTAKLGERIKIGNFARLSI